MKLTSNQDGRQAKNRKKGDDFFLNFITLFSIFSLVAILVGSQDHRTQFWKEAIQGPFH
jgi:hypothetical protein